MSKDFDWLGLASRLFCVIVIALAAVALPTVAIRLFMPFLLSGVLCSAVISASRRLSRLVPIGERALRMILLALSFVGIAVILFNLCRRLYAEISEIRLFFKLLADCLYHGLQIFFIRKTWHMRMDQFVFF